MLISACNIFRNSLKISKNFYQFSKIIKLAPRQQIKVESFSDTIMRSKSLFKNLIFNNQFLLNIQQKGQQQKINAFIDHISKMNNEVNSYTLMFKITYQQALNVVQQVHKYKTLENSIKMLANKQVYSFKERQYLTKLFHLLSIFYRRVSLQGGKANQYKESLKYFVEVFNKYFIVLRYAENQDLMINYIFLICFTIQQRLIDDNRSYFTNQKLVIDQIMQRFENTRSNLTSFNILLFYRFAYQSTMISHYHQKYYQFLKLLTSKLHNQWEDEPYFKKNIHYFLFYFNKLFYNSPKIMKTIEKILASQNNQYTLSTYILAFNTFLNLNNQLYHNKPLPSIVQKSLKKIVKELQLRIKNDSATGKNQQIQNIKKQNRMQNILLNLMSTLIYSSIWNYQIWKLYLEWLVKQQNYKKIPIYYTYILFQLLDIDKDIIPQKVQQLMIQTKETLLHKNNFRPENIDLREEYTRNFSQNMKRHFTQQQQMAAVIRSVSKLTIKSQAIVLVRFFFVDVLIGDKFVIQVNNKLHYIYYEQNNQKLENLKSKFRKRILQKLGYKVLLVDIDQFSEGNYLFLRHLEKEFGFHNQK